MRVVINRWVAVERVDVALERSDYGRRECAQPLGRYVNVSAGLASDEVGDAEPGQINLYDPRIGIPGERRRHFGSLGQADVLAGRAVALGDQQAVAKHERELLGSVIRDHLPNGIGRSCRHPRRVAKPVAVSGWPRA